MTVMQCDGLVTGIAKGAGGVLAISSNFFGAAVMHPLYGGASLLGNNAKLEVKTDGLGSFRK
jgi:hypothetical protein